MGSIPGRGTKIPHAAKQLSSCSTTTRESMYHNARSYMTRERPHMPQLRPNTAPQKSSRKDLEMISLSQQGAVYYRIKKLSQTSTFSKK